MLGLSYISWLGLVLGSSVCSIAANPFSPGPSETYFWGVFSPAMVEVSPGDHPVGQEPGHWSRPDSAAEVWGQVVYIGAVAGNGADQLELGEAAGVHGRAVVVLWDYDASCEPTPFDGSEAWGVAGEKAYFRAMLREKDEWAEGLPTFDVYFAGETIYPFTATKHGRDYARYLREERQWTPDSDAVERALTPAETFELVRVLPSACEYATRPSSAAMRLNHVLRTWGAKRRLHPAAKIFEQHVRWRDGEKRHLQEEC